MHASYRVPLPLPDHLLRNTRLRNPVQRVFWYRLRVSTSERKCKAGTFGPQNVFCSNAPSISFYGDIDGRCIGCLFIAELSWQVFGVSRSPLEYYCRHKFLRILVSYCSVLPKEKAWLFCVLSVSYFPFSFLFLGCFLVWVRVDLNEECFSVFFSIFPKFWYFPILGRNQEIPKFRENTEKKLKNSPR